jgi:hypothetical protein
MVDQETIAVARAEVDGAITVLSSPLRSKR